MATPAAWLLIIRYGVATVEAAGSRYVSFPHPFGEGHAHVQKTLRRSRSRSAGSRKLHRKSTSRRPFFAAEPDILAWSPSGHARGSILSSLLRQQTDPGGPPGATSLECAD